MLYFILPSQRLIEKNDFRHSKGAYDDLLIQVKLTGAPYEYRGKQF
jgi:hypothetical protein